MQENPNLKPYAFFGLEFKPITGTGQVISHCPFCEHENPKFHVNKNTGQYNCKHCGMEGNNYTFLKEIHATCLAETTEEHYRELCDIRGIPWKVFQDNELAFDNARISATPRWLIPVGNQRGGITNLRIWLPPTDHKDAMVMGVGGMPLTLYRLDSLKGAGPVYICEGEWDALAFDYLRKKARQNGSVLAVPGAQVFKKSWAEQLLQNRDVVFLYDNDEAGEKGMQKNAFLLQGKASSVRTIKWGASYDDKFDLRDYVYGVSQNGADYVGAWEELHGLLVYPSNFEPTSPAQDEPALVRKTFESVVKDFRQVYHWTQNEEDGLAVIAATTLSVQIPGDPVWVYIIAPSGGGKTILLRAFEKSSYCIFRNSVTSKSMISGYKLPDDVDPSLIPKLVGKCFILKDFTETLSASQAEKEEIFSVWRGAFDGVCEKTFGNGVTRYYPNCHFSMVVGVTDMIHAENKATLGERFLKYQMIKGEDYDSHEHIAKAVAGTSVQVESEDFLKKVTAAFMDQRIEASQVPKVPKWLEKRIIDLAQLVATLRAEVERKDGDLAYPPVPEIGTRIAKQLYKLAQSLAIVYGSKAAGKKEFRLVQKVAMDSAYGWPLMIMQLFMAAKEPVNSHYLTLRLKLSRTTVDRKVEDMQLLGLIEKKANEENDNRPGNPGFYFVVVNRIRKLWLNMEKEI